MKKFLTFVLVLAMVLSVSSVALALTGDGTESNPYVVNNQGDLEAALATAGGVIQRGASFNITEGGTPSHKYEITGKDFTLNLGGNTLTTAKLFDIKNNAKLTVKNGTIEYTKTGNNLAFQLFGAGAQLIIESDATINSASNVVNLYGPNVTLTSSGHLKSTGGNGVTISGNGTATYGGTTINITGGSVISESGTAIYHPQDGTLNINGGTVKGATGIEMRAGTLNMSGGTVTATAAYAAPVANGSGATTKGGVAIAVSQHSTNKAISVNITDGTLNADSGKALHAYDVQDPSTGDPSTLKIEDGTFNAPVEVATSANLDADTKDGFISGGTFSADPSAYLESDAVAASINEGGTDSYAVGKESIQKKVKDMVDSGKNPEDITVTVTNGTVNFNTGDLPGKVKITDNDSTGSVTVNNQPVSSAPVAMPTPVPEKPASSGSGISVKYNGGNSFSTSKSDVPTGVEIDGVPVTFNGTGSNFTVGCISSDAKWVTVRWNSTSVTTNFTPDGLVECTTVSIPKTGDMSFWAAIAQFLGF